MYIQDDDQFLLNAILDDGDGLLLAAAVYKWNAASGMLQLITILHAKDGGVDDSAAVAPPRWIPVHKEKENVLVANGWSFLDGDDESGPMSAYYDNADNAANQEGTYRPQWGQPVGVEEQGSNGSEEQLLPSLSDLGYLVNPCRRRRFWQRRAAFRVTR